MSRFTSGLGLPIIPVHVSGRSGGIGMRSGMILRRVFPGLDAIVTTVVDGPPEPSCSECAACIPGSGKPVKLNRG